MRSIIIVCSFFLYIHQINAGEVIVKGNNIDYAGESITFKMYENYITSNEKKLVVFTPGPSGDFSFELSIPETEFIFAHLGSYFLYMYMEPGKSYEIELPPRKSKTPDEKLNPYFEEIHEPVTILSSKPIHEAKPDNKTTELNVLIKNFDKRFDPIYADYSINVYSNTKPSKNDTLLEKLDSTYRTINQPYFKEYFTYKIGILKFMSSRFKSRNISDHYFLNKPVLYRNPAYMELFNQVYEKYFVYFGRTQSGKIIYEDINVRKSITGLESTLSQDEVLSNDTLKELVILKGIHDGFYEMDFSRTGLLQILDSLSLNSHITYHQEVAKDIREKVTKLLPGYSPPSFRLLNQDSTWFTLDNYKGSMVYIIFCTTQNYACFKEYDQLKKIQQKHSDILKIVTICVDESWQYIRKFTKKYDYNWTFLYYGDQPEILKDYDIRTIPTYYLIGSDGKLIMSPAPAPSEQFEMYLFDYLKNKHLL